jgi:hypothetical protein
MDLAAGFCEKGRQNNTEMSVFVLKWKLSFWKLNDFQAPQG